MACASEVPSSSSITRYAVPSSLSPWSKISMMLGCESLWAAFASRRKRSRTTRSLLSDGLRIFTAHGRSTSLWRARYTVAMPPSPSTSSMR